MAVEQRHEAVLVCRRKMSRHAECCQERKEFHEWLGLCDPHGEPAVDGEGLACDVVVFYQFHDEACDLAWSAFAMEWDAPIPLVPPVTSAILPASFMELDVLRLWAEIGANGRETSSSVESPPVRVYRSAKQWSEITGMFWAAEG